MKLASFNALAIALIAIAWFASAPDSAPTIVHQPAPRSIAPRTATQPSTGAATLSAASAVAIAAPAKTSPAAQALLDQLHAATPSNSTSDSQQTQARAVMYERLASLDGQVAVTELLKHEGEPFQRQLIGSVLAAWADKQPLEALAWLHDEAQDSLATRGYTAPPAFYDKTFRALATRSPSSAAASLAAIEASPSRLRALSAMLAVAKEKGSIAATLTALTASSDDLRAIDMALLNKLTGDAIGYKEWQAKVITPSEQKELAAELEHSAPTTLAATTK